MNQQSLTCAGFAFAALVFAACGGDSKTSGGSVEDQEVIAISDKTISGVSQKGPFVNGSSVTVQELNGETLAQTGNSYEGKIKNDLGEFSVKVTKLASQYALLKANGFYRNEVSGEKSKSQVTLYALTDLSNRDEVNVNLLTHLAYERSLYLATGKDSLSVSEAKKQAEAEVLKTFGIEGDFVAAEDLNIFGENDQSAALLAVSVLMQGNLSEGDFSERLANYAADIESDGVWNDSKTATKIADWANYQGLGSGLVKIRENITKWDLSADVPAFEKYVNNFWWKNYGLGTCDKKREEEVLKNQNSASANADEYYICKSKSWQVASDIEKDTYKWEKGEDADVKYGDVVKENCYVFEDKAWRFGNKLDCSLDLQGCTKLRQDTVGKGSDKVWHICDAKSWRDATTYEKDTFGWKDSTDGAIKKGNVTDSIYVFDKTKWRTTSNIEAKLGGCVSAVADSVGKVGSTYYICRSNKWIEASAIEYDTYRWTTGKDGDNKVGSVNADNCYVFENNVWRGGNKSDCSLGLRGCTALRQDTVGKGSDNVWHICDARSWRNATNIEKDTATWGAGTFDGEVRVGQVNTTVYYIYGTLNHAWRNATTLEKDTYDYTNNMDWLAGTDGEIKKGSVTDSVYVYDASAWRTADDIEKMLGGCVASIADSIGEVGSTYYICTPRKWVVATALQYDTYKWPAGEDGDSKLGDINTNICYVYDLSVVYGGWRTGNSNDCSLGLGGCTNGFEGEMTISPTYSSYFVCDANSWREATAEEEQAKASCTVASDSHFSKDSTKFCENGTFHETTIYDYPLGTDWTNPEKTYGTLYDERDGRSYKTIEIGGFVVMAENLNYADSSKNVYLKGNNWCYQGDSVNCLKGGRYYTWTAAMNIDSKWQNAEVPVGYINEIHQGICPIGWHIPTECEWNNLYDSLGSTPYAMQAKKNWHWNDATNVSGFSALSVGFRNNGFDRVGSNALFWSSAEFYCEGVYHGKGAYYWDLYANSAYYTFSSLAKAMGVSVRCFKNQERVCERNGS